MKFKPKEVMVNLPVVFLFDTEDNISVMASNFNNFLPGKVKMKYETLGTLNGQFVGLFYLQRNNESQQLRDEFMRLIEEEQVAAHELNSSVKQEKEHESDCGCKSCMGM